MRASVCVLLLSLLSIGTSAAGDDLSSQVVLSVSIEAQPPSSGFTTTLMIVRLSQGELDSFAVFSEPSHSLLFFVRHSDIDPVAIKNSPWYQSDVAPFLNPLNSACEMATPIHAGQVFAMQHQRRPEGDDRLVFSGFGKALVPYRGNDVARVSLFHQTGSATPIIQSFSLLRPSGGAEGHSPLEGTYLCGCGANQPQPCGQGNGNCSGCITCQSKYGGDECGCRLESTTECGHCGNSFPQCSLDVPLC